MLQGWAEVFIDAGLAIKAVILSFAQRQAFPPSPLSGDPFVSGRIHSDSSRNMQLLKLFTGSLFCYPHAFPDHFRADIDSIIIINQMNTHIRP